MERRLARLSLRYLLFPRETHLGPCTRIGAACTGECIHSSRWTCLLELSGLDCLMSLHVLRALFSAHIRSLMVVRKNQVRALTDFGNIETSAQSTPTFEPASMSRRNGTIRRYSMRRMHCWLLYLCIHAENLHYQYSMRELCRQIYRAHVQSGWGSVSGAAMRHSGVPVPEAEGWVKTAKQIIIPCLRAARTNVHCRGNTQG